MYRVSPGLIGKPELPKTNSRSPIGAMELSTADTVSMLEKYETPPEIENGLEVTLILEAP
jgi:hypothetical protein